MTIGHRDDAGLMQSQDKANAFLVGDGANKLLSARTGQTENVLDSVRRRDFQVSLRCRFFRC
jgi:hypothetical protein